jgi:hypothetical protein
MTSTAEHKTVVEEFIQALFTKGDRLVVDRYPADDLLLTIPPMPALSGDATGFRAAKLRAASTDFTERARDGALKLPLASDCMLIRGREACRYREQH